MIMLIKKINTNMKFKSRLFCNFLVQAGVFLIILPLFLHSISGAASAQSTEKTKAFLRGVSSYEDGKYAESINSFLQLADSGINNGRLFYNLGNAYLKNDDLGRAILWYERALKYLPRDPDLEFNYNYALSLTKDEKEITLLPIYKIIFFWKFLLSPIVIIWISIAMSAVFWIIVIYRLVTEKRIFNSVTSFLLILSFIFTFTVLYNFHEDYNMDRAVILSEEVSVRSGLTDNSTELFKLHAGTKVMIEEESGQYVKVHFSEGKLGWIHKSYAEII